MDDDILYEGLNISAMSRNLKKAQILLKKALGDIDNLKKQNKIIVLELANKKDDPISYFKNDPTFRGFFKK